MLLVLLERLARRRRPGASPLWTAAAVAAWAFRRYQRNVGRDTVVLTEELRPGQSLLISHTHQPHG